MRIQVEAGQTQGTSGHNSRVGAIGVDPPPGSSHSGGIGGAEDRVDISGATRALSVTSAGIAAKIARLAPAVRGGSYDISSSVLSQAILGAAVR